MFRGVSCICLVVITLFCFVSCERDFSEKVKVPIQFEKVFIPSENRVELIFDRSDFDVSSAESISNYVVKSLADSSVLSINSVNVVGDRLAINFNEDLTTNEGYSIDVYNVTDINDTPVAYSQQLINFRVARIEFVGGEIDPPNLINLSFNGELDYTEGVNNDINNFKLKVGDETLFPSQVDVLFNRLSLTFDNPFENGNYELTMTNVKAINMAVIENETYSFTYTGNVIVEELPTQWFYFEDIPLQCTSSLSSQTLYIDWDKGLLSQFVDEIDYDLYMFFDKYSAAIYSNYIPFEGVLGLCVVEESIENVTDISPYIDILYAYTNREYRRSIYTPYEYSNYGLTPYYRPWCAVDVEDVFAFNYEIELYNLPEYNFEYNHYNPTIPFRIIPDRTIVFKTNRGKYGKMEMTGLYENDMPPDMVPHDYTYSLSFKGVVQQNGSTNLDIPYN